MSEEKLTQFNCKGNDNELKSLDVRKTEQYTVTIRK